MEPGQDGQREPRLEAAANSTAIGWTTGIIAAVLAMGGVAKVGRVLWMKYGRHRANLARCHALPVIRVPSIPPAPPSLPPTLSSIIIMSDTDNDSNSGLDGTRDGGFLGSVGGLRQATNVTFIISPGLGGLRALGDGTDEGAMDGAANNGAVMDEDAQGMGMAPGLSSSDEFVSADECPSPPPNPRKGEPEPKGPNDGEDQGGPSRAVVPVAFVTRHATQWLVTFATAATRIPT